MHCARSSLRLSCPDDAHDQKELIKSVRHLTPSFLVLVTRCRKQAVFSADQKGTELSASNRNALYV